MSPTKLLLASFATLMLFCLPTAAKDDVPAREAAFDRCMSRYAACLRKCDYAPNTTPKIYRDCNEACDSKANSCIKKALEMAREGGMSTPNESIFSTESMGSSSGGGGSGGNGGGGGGPGVDHSTGNAGMSGGSGGGIIY